MSDATVFDDSTHPLHKIPIEVTVSVGQARPLVKELLALKRDDVLPLTSQLDDPVELFIGDRLIARGELQEAGDDLPGQLAVRLTEIVNLSDALE